MTKYPKAIWDPLSPVQTEPVLQRHDVVCLHTMAGTFEQTNAFFHQNGYGGTESHFGLSGAGVLKQWQDLDHEADSNFHGNSRCISIETADRGESFPAWEGSDVPAWTDAQIEVIVELVGWLCDRYDIPRVLLPDSKPGRRGIAYHRLGVPHSTGNPNAPGGPWHGPGSELWTHPEKGRGKVCPGDRRIDQLVNVVLPRLLDSQEDLAMDKAELREIVREEVTAVLNGQARRVEGIESWERYLEILLETARRGAATPTG